MCNKFIHVNNSHVLCSSIDSKDSLDGLRFHPKLMGPNPNNGPNYVTKKGLKPDMSICPPCHVVSYSQNSELFDHWHLHKYFH